MTIRLREEIARVRESVKRVQGTGASEGVGPARTRTNPPLHPPAPDGSAEASGPSPTSHAEESQALTFPSLKLPEASTDRPSPAGGGQSGRAPDVAASAGRGPARWNESPFPPESLPTLAQGSEAPSAVRAPVATPASPASLAFVPVWGNAPLSLGPLDASVADPRIGDILVVGPDRVFAEVDGTLTRVPVAFGSDEAVLALAQRIAAPLGRELTVAHPFMDARMDALGLRVTATIPPFSRRPTLSIRKTRSVAATEEDLLVSGFASPEALRLLGEAVRARRNLVITGPTGAGKTTLARYLARHVPPQERIITVEETYELGLSELHPHVVELETRSGPYAIDADLALRQVLHMRPDRIIVGEVRHKEALQLLIAMGTGHRGSWTTLHSDRSEDVFDRLVFAMRLGAPDMPMDALFRYAVRTVDLVVQVGRLSQVPQGTPGSRKGGEPVRYLEGIYEVTDLESGNRVQLKPLYRYDPTLPEAPPRSGGRSRTAGGEKSEGGRKA